MWRYKSCSFKCIHFISFYVVTSPPANPVAWSVHLRKSSAIKLLRVVFLKGSHKTNQSTTEEENHQLPLPNLSLNNWDLHILSLLLSCVDRNETMANCKVTSLGIAEIRTCQRRHEALALLKSFTCNWRWRQNVGNRFQDNKLQV